MPKLTKEQKQDNKLFEEFKKKFGLRLKQVSSKRVSHQDIRQEFRRLDSMARLLEGNSTCVAVYFHLPTETIWIFNNNIHDNSRESNVYIREMQHIFNLITNEQLTLQTIKSNLLDIIVSNIAQEERWAMATLKTQKKILHEEIGSYLDNLLKSGVSTKAWQNNFQPDLDYIANVGFLEKIKNKTAKIVRDFLKIRDFLLYNHKKNPLAQSLLRAIKNKKLKVQHTEIKDVHAEIRALSQIKSMNAESNYIGISKLCCDHCALAMGAFDMSTRGLHGQRAKWAVPTFLRDSPENMKIYLGDELYAIYDKLLAKTKKDALKFIADKKSNPTKEDARHGRHMYADSSDSDVEFGVSFDDEQLADDLNDFDLNDVWQIRGMKMDYEGEIEALVDIGLSLHEIFKLYSESDNKFNALSSETFLAFIKDYAKCYNDNEQDVFEKMGNIYDEYRDLFNNMLGNQDKVFEHSIDALKIEYIASCELTDDDDVDDYETNHFENACAVLQENNGWGYIEKNDSENRYGYSSSDEDSEQHFIDNNPDDFNGGDFSSLSDYSSGGEEKDDSESETNSSTNSDEESLQYADSRIPHGSTSIFSHVPNSNSVVSVTRKPIILKFD